MELTSSKDLLKMELADRITANPAYSLRAMARQVGLSPSMMSSVLRGNKKLSVERAYEVAKKLKFTKPRREYLVTLVQYEQAKSADQKADLMEKLHQLVPQPKTTLLDLDLFRTIADWFHLPLLELTNTKDFELNADTAARALGISPFEADAAIERLLRLELLEEKQGRLQKAQSILLANSPLPNGALRKYHQQMLAKASRALIDQTPAEKFIGSETFAFNTHDLKKANEILEDCFTRMVKLAGSRKNKKHVYHMGIQLFRLTKENA